MTGVAIAFRLNEGLKPAIIAARKRGEDFTPAMEMIADELVRSTIERFETETDPDGQRWTPSKRAIIENGRTLAKSGQLMASITPKATADAAIVATNKAYAAAMQFGDTSEHNVREHQRTIRQAFGKRLKTPLQIIVGAFKRLANTPARRFMGISIEDRGYIEEVLADHMTGALGGGRA